MRISKKMVWLALAMASLGANQSPAATAECAVDAYEAYAHTQRSTPRYMGCQPEYGQAAGEVRFTAVQGKGLICAGKTPASGNEPTHITARFFGTPGSAVGTVRNGWRVTGYHITGGPVTEQLRSDKTLLPSRHRDTLISFHFSITQRGAEFSRELRTIMISKPDGDCSKALEEAFDLSR